MNQAWSSECSAKSKLRQDRRDAADSARYRANAELLSDDTQPTRLLDHISGIGIRRRDRVAKLSHSLIQLDTIDGIKLGSRLSNPLKKAQCFVEADALHMLCLCGGTDGSHSPD